MNPNDNNEDCGEDWPELDAIENIIDRARLYAAENGCAVKILFQIEFTGKAHNEVQERYTATATSLESNSATNNRKINQDLKRIITEEMMYAFPDITDVTLDPNNPEHKQILEATTQFMEENELKPNSSTDNKPHDGIISMKLLEDEGNQDGR